MRTLLKSALLLAANTSALLAQEGGAHAEAPGLVSLRVNLMFWTLILFVVLYLILRKWAFPKIFEAVEAREKTLQDAIDAAKRDRDEAEKLLADHRRAIEGARDDAQKLIADGRATAEKMRAELIEHTHTEQQDMLDRARREIESEKERALAQLRREAVNLAILGASKVIEENLDSSKNRELVESYLSSLGTLKVRQ